MQVFIVSYDLRQPGRNYQPLYNRLHEWKAVQALQSVWFIEWNATAEQIRDDLRGHMDMNDGLFVGLLNGQAAWQELNGTSGQTVKTWLER